MNVKPLVDCEYSNKKAPRQRRGAGIQEHLLRLVAVGQQALGREVTDEGLAAGELDLIALIVEEDGGRFDGLAYPVAGDIAAADEDISIALANALHYRHDAVVVGVFVFYTLDNHVGEGNPVLQFFTSNLFLSTFGQVSVNDNPRQNFVSLTHENVAATSQQANG